MKTVLSIIISLLVPLAMSAQQQDFDKVVIKSQKISETVYMLEGMGGNIGVCAGPDGVFIIDDQFAPLTEKIKASIAEISDKPVQFVINTHFHFDHAGGNENFGKGGSVIVAHHNARKRLEEDQDVMENDQEATSPAGLPKITFGGAMTFHYNGETVDLYHKGPAHTDGDVIIHFKESNIIHGGDVFVRYGLPFIDVDNGGNVDGMISFIEALLSLCNDETKIIPGHGAVASKRDIEEFLQMIKTIRERIKALADKGKSYEDILKKKDDVLKGYEDNGVGAGRFIKSVYEGVKRG